MQVLKPHAFKGCDRAWMPRRPHLDIDELIDGQHAAQPLILVLTALHMRPSFCTFLAFKTNQPYDVCKTNKRGQ